MYVWLHWVESGKVRIHWRIEESQWQDSKYRKLAIKMSILNIVVNQMKFIAVADEKAFYLRWTERPTDWLTNWLSDWLTESVQKYSIELNRT